MCKSWDQHRGGQRRSSFEVMPWKSAAKLYLNCFTVVSGILESCILVEQGCHWNPLCRNFSLGVPGTSLAFICKPFKSTVLTFKGIPSHTACHFSSWFVRYTWSHPHPMLLCELRKAKADGDNANLHSDRQWRVVKLRTLLWRSYISFFRVSF